jgi:hypothetical protein
VQIMSAKSLKSLAAANWSTACGMVTSSPSVMAAYVAWPPNAEALSLSIFRRPSRGRNPRWPNKLALSPRWAAAASG